MPLRRAVGLGPEIGDHVVVAPGPAINGWAPKSTDGPRTRRMGPEINGWAPTLFDSAVGLGPDVDRCIPVKSTCCSTCCIAHSAEALTAGLCGPTSHRCNPFRRDHLCSTLALQIVAVPQTGAWCDVGIVPTTPLRVVPESHHEGPYVDCPPRLLLGRCDRSDPMFRFPAR